jgi:hypothetical protein
MAKTKKQYRRRRQESDEEPENVSADVHRKVIVTQTLDMGANDFQEKKLRNKVDFKAIKVETRTYDSNTLKEIQKEQLIRKKPIQDLVQEDKVKVPEATIPDQKAIEEAKKARHKKRIIEALPVKTESDYIPLTVSKPNETESRLIREDQVDEEDFDDYKGSSVLFGESAVKSAKEKERLEKVEMLTIKDDDEEDDDQVQRWELERIHLGQRSHMEIALVEEHLLKTEPSIPFLSIPEVAILPNNQELIIHLENTIKNMVFAVEQHEQQVKNIEFEMKEFHSSLQNMTINMENYSNQYDYYQDLSSYMRDLADFLDVKEPILEQLEHGYLDLSIYNYQSQMVSKYESLDYYASFFEASFKPCHITVNDEIFDKDSLDKQADQLLEDASDAFKEISIVKEKLESWKLRYPRDYVEYLICTLGMNC